MLLHWAGLCNPYESLPTWDILWTQQCIWAPSPSLGANTFKHWVTDFQFDLHLKHHNKYKNTINFILFFLTSVVPLPTGDYGKTNLTLHHELTWVGLNCPCRLRSSGLDFRQGYIHVLFIGHTLVGALLYLSWSVKSCSKTSFPLLWYDNSAILGNLESVLLRSEMQEDPKGLNVNMLPSR